MRRLYLFNLKQTIRNKEEMFWPLLFPLILGTFFYFSFAKSDIEYMKRIDTAVVGSENAVFETFLEKMDGEVLALHPMEEEEAVGALKDGAVEGIFYAEKEPSLTVAGTQINESILESLLQGYTENRKMLEEIAKEHPLKMASAVKTISAYGEFVKPVNVTGNEVNNNLSYFFALIAMACLFGAFSGMTAAVKLRADQSPLAARRSIVPVGRLSMVVSEMMAVFTIQFLNICILLCYLRFVLRIPFGAKWPLLLPVCILGSITGVAVGIYIGTLQLSEGLKSGIIVGSSLFMSFLSGLMAGNMKNIVEHHAPIVNRINPAALIVDGFYNITVYENMGRYTMSLLSLAVITVLLTAVSFLKLRRERYDSI